MLIFPPSRPLGVADYLPRLPAFLFSQAITYSAPLLVLAERSQPTLRPDAEAARRKL